MVQQSKTLHIIIQKESDAEGDPKINILVATHTSDEKKRKVTDTYTTNVNSPQNIIDQLNLPNDHPSD